MLQQYKYSWRKFLFYFSQKVICIFSKKLCVCGFVCVSLYYTFSSQAPKIYVFIITRISHKSIYFCYSFFCWTWYSRQGHTIAICNIIINLITFPYFGLQVVYFYKWIYIFSTHISSALILTDKIPSWVSKAVLDFWIFLWILLRVSFLNLVFINPEKVVWWYIQQQS